MTMEERAKEMLRFVVSMAFLVAVSSFSDEGHR